ncbi:hypothetical protein RSOL_400650 [Rhizoctonia solani AG-3 Rhs1AP]|uniref:CxC2-like cysteine cluster KDZ transposase-associated domain-containing protein n=1 Tax=Rhizoctonia solani AG-3 Rhs1AP TaxID=1086054 RepID=X8JC32_9AGAM|nr:hypothetical protein RSOL_400650 [Rhizoctonia solani AG-3 Rhs1AP]
MEYNSPAGALCICETPQGERFRCHDCITDHRFCRPCLKSLHRFLPHHRISRWDGITWTRSSLLAEGSHLNLSNHQGSCLRSPSRRLLLGDVNGFSEIEVTYCLCPNAAEPYVQLLRSSIMPCSTDKPSSGFTFRALRLFDFLAADAKLSCSRYHAVLQRQTNNIEPEEHPPRLRELLRVSRQWNFLQQLKRSGQSSTAPESLGCLALRCPACPRLDVNHTQDDISPSSRYLFAQQLSYDGSFQLVRKNKAADEFDICLTDGLSYWVDRIPYLNHLEANEETDYQQTTKNDSCNNHRAANDTWVRQSGVAETGVGAVTCARHTFFLPQGCVSYWKGERYVYTDFAIACVIAILMNEGAEDIGVFYDIFCHWSKNFWSRALRIQTPAGALQRPFRFYGGVPKYHLAGHIDSCYARYSLNNMHGVGRLDAEGCEMAEEQEEAWLVLHENLDDELTAKWSGMSTEPVLVNNKWTSTSRVRTVLDLNTKESARLMDSDSTEPGLTAPSWISEGIDIEKIQLKLRDDVIAFGEKLTDRQALEVHKRRVSLTSRINTHREHAALFIDLLPNKLSTTSVSQETGGQPEQAVLYLPSHLSRRLDKTERSTWAIDLEKIVRKAECFECLRRIRVACSQKSQMLIGKTKNARGEVANTRAQVMITRLEQRIKSAMAEYNRSFEALENLSVEADTLNPFKKVKDTDFTGLMSLLRGVRELEEGRKRLPWFWTVRETGLKSGKDEDEEETNDAIRVEWFRGRERFRRWQEEVLWLRRELASTLFSFAHSKDTWSKLSQSAYAGVHPGYRSYSRRQSDVYHGLLVSGLRKGLLVLKVCQFKTDQRI